MDSRSSRIDFSAGSISTKLDILKAGQLQDIPTAMDSINLSTLQAVTSELVTALMSNIPVFNPPAALKSARTSTVMDIRLNDIKVRLTLRFRLNVQLDPLVVSSIAHATVASPLTTAVATVASNDAIEQTDYEDKLAEYMARTQQGGSVAAANITGVTPAAKMGHEPLTGQYL